MADEPKGARGLLDRSQNREEKGGKERDEKKVLHSSKHRSLAGTGMPTNEVTETAKQKGDVTEERRKKDAGGADNEGMTLPCRTGRSV